MADQKKVSTPAEAATQVEESSEFASLLNKEFRPKTDRAAEEIESAVQTLAEYVLKGRRTVPAALLEAGYEFRWPELKPSLAALVKR